MAGDAHDIKNNMAAYASFDVWLAFWNHSIIALDALDIANLLHILITWCLIYIDI